MPRKNKKLPRHLLVIRTSAMGDVAPCAPRPEGGVSRGEGDRCDQIAVPSLFRRGGCRFFGYRNPPHAPGYPGRHSVRPRSGRVEDRRGGRHAQCTAFEDGACGTPPAGDSRFGNSQGADRKIHAAGTRFGRCETFETHRHPLLRRLPSLGIRLSRSPAGRETPPTQSHGRKTGYMDRFRAVLRPAGQDLSRKVERRSRPSVERAFRPGFRPQRRRRGSRIRPPHGGALSERHGIVWQDKAGG